MVAREANPVAKTSYMRLLIFFSSFSNRYWKMDTRKLSPNVPFCISFSFSYFFTASFLCMGRNSLGVRCMGTLPYATLYFCSFLFAKRSSIGSMIECNTLCSCKRTLVQSSLGIRYSHCLCSLLKKSSREVLRPFVWTGVALSPISYSVDLQVYKLSH